MDRLDVASSRPTDRSELTVASEMAMASAFSKQKSALSSPSKQHSRNSSRTDLSELAIASEMKMASAISKPKKSALSSPSKQQSRNSRRLRRTVTFATKASATIISALDDMSQHEKESVWRTAKDRQEDETNIVHTVKAYRKATVTSESKQQLPPDMSPRGIEHLIYPEKRDQLRRRRELMVDAILDLQDEYWNDGVHLADPDALRAVSIRYSSFDVQESIKLGASDEAYIRRQRRLEGFDSLTSKSFLEISKKILGKQ